MAATKLIQIGDEVKLRGLKDQPIAVVTLNTADRFCCITKEGFTFNTSREEASPMKTGRRFLEISRMLKSMQM